MRKRDRSVAVAAQSKVQDVLRCIAVSVDDDSVLPSLLLKVLRIQADLEGVDGDRLSVVVPPQHRFQFERGVFMEYLRRVVS